MQESKNIKIALVLSGGGSRAAYQVGVLKALAEMSSSDAPIPFPIVVGTSAGAINTAALAIYGARFCDAVTRLQRIWRNFHVHQVFRSDFFGVMKSGAHWLLSVFLGGLGLHNPASFLDRTPLKKLLEKYLPCEQIEKSIKRGVLESVCITASAYGAGMSVVFYESSKNIAPWQRARRMGKSEKITNDHLMASSAIPFVFSAIRLGNDYYGDGSIRQAAPISPAIHMGADKVLVIGVTNKHKQKLNRNNTPPSYPTLGKIGGHILNSIFIDSMEADLERVDRINKTIELITSRKANDDHITLRKIETLVISPSQDLQEIALKHIASMPRTIRFFLRGIGALGNSGSSILSYIMFEKSFCRELIALGYKDAINIKNELKTFVFTNN